MKGHYEILDGLRGTAALSVVAFHMAELATDSLAHDPLRHTGLAVDFFFVLSGFVIAHAYDHRLSSAAQPARRLSVGAFLVRRLIRLHPMVLMGMTLGLISFLLDPFVGPALGSGPAQTSVAMVVLVYGLSLLLLPEPCLPHRFGETHCLDAPAWSLFQEYIGNLFYGFVGRRLPLGWLAGFCAIAALTLVFTMKGFANLAQGWDWHSLAMGPVRLAYAFPVGMLVYRLNLRVRLPLAYVWLSLALLAIFTAPLMAPHTSLVEAACVIFVFPAMIALGAGQTRVEGVLGKLCRLTGRLSYPLYMVHYPAIYLYAHWMWHTNPAPGLILPVSVGLYVVIIAAAWLIMTYYDEPVRAYLQRRFVDGRAPAQLASARASV